METCQCYYSPLVHQAKAVANSSSYASQRSSLTSHLSLYKRKSTSKREQSTDAGANTEPSLLELC